MDDEKGISQHDLVEDSKIVTPGTRATGIFNVTTGLKTPNDAHPAPWIAAAAIALSKMFAVPWLSFQRLASQRVMPLCLIHHNPE